jgi:hypothetical protein
MEGLSPGKPVRLPHDSGDFPTLKMAYGEIAVIHASAGIKRALAIAYTVLWAWDRHCTRAKQAKVRPLDHVVLMLDEIEAHLHPKWQRLIVPALLQMIQSVAENVQVQLIVATHSPLVLASAEPAFDDELDSLHHLELAKTQVVLARTPFVNYGSIDAWLTSDIFGMSEARSIDAESAIRDATKLQLLDSPDKKLVQEVDKRLRSLLSSTDGFWPRWLYFAEQHGVVDASSTAGR